MLGGVGATPDWQGMKKSQAQSITTLEEAPESERHRRMLQYSIAMGIRMVCVVLLFFVHGWWLALVVIAAIALPYFAVVIANTGNRRSGDVIENPGGVVAIREPGVTYTPTVVDDEER
jgi:hypothetical protein